MTPTTKLRFVERKNFTEDAANPQTFRILQQWWEAHATGMTSTNGEKWVAASAGEWRDVPLEEEQA